MFKKVLKRLTNNASLKIVSVFISMILWMVVVNYDNPEISNTYTIPVTVVNEDILEKMGKVYDVVGQSNLATIYVSGKRSIMEAMSASDFKATADLSQIDFSSSGEEKLVPIDITVSRNERQLNITRKTVNMRVTIEELSVQRNYISCDTQGELAEGYAIGDVTVSPNLLKVSGPASIVSRISRIAAVVNVEGLNSDITDRITPVLYDENGDVIESSQLKISQEKVTVDIKILSKKTVPIRCETTGTPADGYEFVGLEYAPENVTIKGESSVLDNVEEILIPGEAINIDGATADIENDIDITEYLSEGVSLVNTDENHVAVKAIVNKLKVKTFKIPVGQIQVNGLSEQYNLEFLDDVLAVTVRGRTEDINKLKEEDIQVSILVSGLGTGSNVVEADIVVDEAYTVIGDNKIRVYISKKEVDTGNTREAARVFKGQTGNFNSQE